MFSRTTLLGSFIAMGLFTMAAQAQAACQTKDFDGKSLSRCKIWPAVQNQAIAVKSTYLADAGDDDAGVFDLDLSIINASTYNPIATYRKPGLTTPMPCALRICASTPPVIDWRRRFGLSVCVQSSRTVPTPFPTRKPIWRCTFAKATSCARCWRVWWLPRATVSS